MILAFDIGKPETTAAMFDGAVVGPHWRLTTHLPRTPDEYVLLLRSLFQAAGMDIASVSGTAICSVVASGDTNRSPTACLECFGKAAVVIDRILRFHQARGRRAVHRWAESSREYAAASTCGSATPSCRPRPCYDVRLHYADGSFTGGIIQPGRRNIGRHAFSPDCSARGHRAYAAKKSDRHTDGRLHQVGVLYVSSGFDRRARQANKEGMERSLAPRDCHGRWRDLRPYCETFDEVDAFLTLQGVRSGTSCWRDSGSGRGWPNKNDADVRDQEVEPIELRDSAAPGAVIRVPRDSEHSQPEAGLV
jgi:pantothenate kinase type III